MKRGREPLRLNISRFKHFYPGEFRHPRWPTRDTVIPARVFWQEMSAMWSIMALERLSMTRAIGLAFASDENPGSRLVADQEFREAHPEA